MMPDQGGVEAKSLFKSSLLGLHNCVGNVFCKRLCCEKKVTEKNADSRAVSVRVHEIYNTLSLEKRGLWDAKTAYEDGTLVFVIERGNVDRNDVMANVGKKHVGILFNGEVYNYSNTGAKVIADGSPDAFLKKFKQVYSPAATLFYGIL
jgi:hypothetical protein